MSDSDPDPVIHITASPGNVDDLSEEVQEATREWGFLEGYEVIVTDHDVSVTNIDAAAKAIAERLDGVEYTDTDD